MRIFQQQDTVIDKIQFAGSPIFIDSLNGINSSAVSTIDSVSSDSSAVIQDTILDSHIAQQSMFTTHQLQVNDFQPSFKNYISNDWITIHLIVCLLLLGWTRVYFGKRLKQILKAFFSVRQTNTLIREGNIFRERISIPLLIIYLVSFSLLIYLAFVELLQGSFFDFTGVQLFSVIMLFVLISWFIKNVVLNFVGFVFRNNLILSDYIYTNFIFNILIGIILMPVIIISIYISAKEIIYFGILLWLLTHLYRLVRELFTGLSYVEFSLFYRILYLCTLEIIPLLVLTKLAMSYLA